MLLFRLYIACFQRGEEMDAQLARLLESAAELRRLGVELETARSRLKILVESGYSYQSEEMITAYQTFSGLEKEWQELERAHLALRDKIMNGG